MFSQCKLVVLPKNRSLWKIRKLEIEFLFLDSMDLKSIYEHAMIYAKQILIPFELMTSNNFNLINFYVDHNLWFSLYLLGAQFYQFQKSKLILPKK